jgi:pimeloyl-ACP methyl ester carboxylesterase
MRAIGQVGDLPGALAAVPRSSPESVSENADVVLLHGFLSSPLSMRLLGRAVRGAGFTPLIPWYASWSIPFDAIVERLATALSRQAIGTDRPVHFIGHSMGGLIARALATRLQPPRIGRMVMLGTPNGGSELADFCSAWPVLRPILGHAEPALITRRDHPAIAALAAPDYPVGIIAGDRPLAKLLRVLPPPHDGKVSVAATHLEGEADHIVLPVSHVLMPFDRRVGRQALHFLQSGKFQR